tara:strand:+ start:107 stop:307 length:201 start_codon:yes stop_codon:yes gene_type:complete
MKILSNILYVSATTSLLIGSILTFEIDEIADYFYLIGTTLFFIKACLSFIIEIKNRKQYISYDTIN